MKLARIARIWLLPDCDLHDGRLAIDQVPVRALAIRGMAVGSLAIHPGSVGLHGGGEPADRLQERTVHHFPISGQ